MAQYFDLSGRNSAPRLIRRAVEFIRAGAVVVYPTDSSYALGCRLGNKEGVERIRAIRSLDDQHHFTFVCSDLSQVGKYAKLDKSHYRLLKAYTPGPYTFILSATREVPRQLRHARRKSIGLRVPEHSITQTLIRELGEPLMSVSLILPADDRPLSDPQEIRTRLEHKVDLVLAGGYGGLDATTIVDLQASYPFIMRIGKGADSWSYLAAT